MRRRATPSPCGRGPGRRKPGQAGEQAAAFGFKGLCEFQLKNYEAALADLLNARELGVEATNLVSALAYHTAIMMTRLEQYEFAL